MLKAKTRKAIKRLRKQKLQRSRRLTRRLKRRYKGGSLPVPEGAVAAVSFPDEVGDVDAVPTLVSKKMFDTIKTV